jgi:hypothetical protein
LKPEEVLPLKIYLCVVNEQISFWLRAWHWVAH